MQFTVTEVLDEYDGPMMVYGQMENGELALAMVYDDDFGYRLWFAAIVSSETIDGVLANKITLRNAFKSHIGPIWLGDAIDYAGSVTTLTPLDGDLPDTWLSAEGCYLRRDSEND